MEKTMTYEIEPQTTVQTERIAERINEMLANEFDLDPSNFDIQANKGGRFHIYVDEEYDFWENPPEFAPSTVLTTFFVLERARDNSTLTPDQQDVLTEAHAILQELEKQNEMD